MGKISKILVLGLIVSLLGTGCVSKKLSDQGNNEETAGEQTMDSTFGEVIENTPTPVPTTSTSVPAIDLEAVKPNEMGKIMVVMFHNFIEAYTSGDKEYTTTLGAFEKLLTDLYDKNYRLINMADYLNNTISVAPGCIPMVFTFDDGTAGQFNLVEDNGKLVVNPRTAVGILESFNRTHPDFGLKGTFYVNLGDNTFPGKGTLPERLQYLIDKGFEIGNHTLNHIDLKKVKSKEEILTQVGGNQKRMQELIPGYPLATLALPLGNNAPEELRSWVSKGEYEGISYENLAIMKVGWDPALSPVSSKFNLADIHRVRASGIKPVDADLAWWLGKLSRGEQYISDGNADTVTVPKAKAAGVDPQKLKGKQLITY